MPIPLSERLQRFLSQSQNLVWVAVKLSNQCRAIIGYHIQPEGKAIGANGEAWLIKTLAPHLGTFVDVGANVGDWAAEVLKHNPNAKVVLFEPGSGAADRLLKRFNGLSNTKIIQAAVGDKAGSLTFYEEANAGERSSVLASHANKTAEKKSVIVATLDGEFGQQPIDLLKVDAEGYDLHVLRGAENLLRDHLINVIQFEYSDAWAEAGSTLAGAIRLLESYGYRVFLLRADGLHPFRRGYYPEHFNYSNFVAVLPRSIHLLKNGVHAPV